jgi:hypothetical protein
VGWTIVVDPAARPVVAALDLAFRTELVAHVERIADDPVATLHRAVGAEMAGLYEYRYRSAVDDQLEFVLRFEGLDDHPARLELVHVTHTSHPNSAA